MDAIQQESVPVPVELARPRRHAVVLLIAVAIVSLALARETLHIAIAATLGDSNKVEAVRRAIALDPDNPDLHHRLGMILYFTMAAFDPTEGIRHLRRATELDPRASYDWLDLANACESSGEAVCADQAFEEAVRLSPRTPRFEWAAGNHYLRADRSDLALAHFRRLLELDPGYAFPTFHLCLGFLENPEIIFQKVLPAGKNPGLKLAYVDFLSNNHQVEFAYRVWQQVVNDGSSFPFSMAETYLNRLIELGRSQEASRVWQNLEGLGAIIKPVSDDPGNLVFNGDFERDPLNAGFDWRYLDVPYLSRDFGDPAAYHGSRCLRLDFAVRRNDEYLAAYQFVPVSADRSYVLSFQARSQGITSDSGPLLRVVDLECPSCLTAFSEGTTGTTPWHRVQLRFSTGPATRLVHLSIFRLRGRTFPMDIAGSFWVDDIVLKPANFDEQTVSR